MVGETGWGSRLLVRGALLMAAWGCEPNSQVPSTTAVQTGAVDRSPATGGIEQGAETGGADGGAGGCGRPETFKQCSADDECALKVDCSFYSVIAIDKESAYRACRGPVVICPEGGDSRWPQTEDGNYVFADAHAIARCIDGQCTATVDVVRDPSEVFPCGPSDNVVLCRVGQDYCRSFPVSVDDPYVELRGECGHGRDATPAPACKRTASRQRDATAATC